MKKTYYKLKMEVFKTGEEQVTIKKIDCGEERIDNGSNYVVNEKGEPYRFDTKEDAINWMNEFVSYRYICPEYRLPDQHTLLNARGLEETGYMRTGNGLIQRKGEKVKM